MHWPDPKRAPNIQDQAHGGAAGKRDWDAWVQDSVEQVKALIKVSPLELLCTPMVASKLPWLSERKAPRCREKTRC